MPEAWVVHPWWEDGRGSYRRFFRWAFGDSQLPALHPRYRYWNAPTLPETVLLLVVASLFRLPVSLATAVATLAALVGVELAVDYGKIWIRLRRHPLRVVIESTMIRLSNDLGRLVGNLSRGRPWGLLERFDYFCDGAHVGGERRIAIVKLVGTIVVLALMSRLMGG